MSECGFVLTSPARYRLVDFDTSLHFSGENPAQLQHADDWFRKILRPFQIAEAFAIKGHDDFGREAQDRADPLNDDELLLQDDSEAISVTRTGRKLNFHYRLPANSADDLAYLTRAEEITLDYTVTRSSDKLWIHAACVVRSESLVFLVAPSGFGKTTLSLGLAGHHFLIATDDVVLFDVVEDRLIPCPRCPRIRGAALSQLGSVGVDLRADADLIGRYVVLPPSRFQSAPSLTPTAIHVFILSKGGPSGSESLSALSLSQGIIEIARHSNLLAQDSDLRFFQRVFGQASFYRLQIGDFARNLAEIIAAVER